VNAVATEFAQALADRYRIERELGRGGMATVFLAEDLRHGRPVAIKLLHPELGAWLGAERFLAEIRITARLQHPNILPLLDSGEVRGGGSSLLYYVMPYVAGETLRARLDRERQLAVPEAIRITKDVAAALAHAHAAGIIHRDIKPENILLGTPNAAAPAPVLLADFGIARSIDAAADRLTGTGMTVGTAAYMSPEQATAERELDARSDIYSLGCVLYEMLAGEPPFTGANPRVILSKQLSDPVRPVSRIRDNVPTAIDAALATALGRSPADRFPDAAAFAAALDGTGSHEVATSGPSVAGAARRRITRRAGIAAGVLGVAAAGWFALSSPTSALGMPAVRVGKFTTPPGDTASAYLAATLNQDVTAALAGTRAARVFVMDSALRAGFAVVGIAARLADSVELRLTVSKDPTGELVGTKVVRRPLGRSHELPDAATDMILDLLGRPRRVAAVRTIPTKDSVAYDLFLKGRYQTDRRTEISTQRAVALLRAAVTRDSGFADGWAGLAMALRQANLRGYKIPGIPANSLVATILDASERALEADSMRSYPWIARAMALRDIEPSARRNAILAYQRAIALDSNNADAWHFYAVAWDDSLEPSRARDAWQHTLRLDPTHRLAIGFLAQHFNWMRQFDSAARWADSGRRIDPINLLIRQQLGLAKLHLGDTAAAAENYRAALGIGKGPDEVQAWVALAAIALRGRNRASADTLFAHALAIADTLHPTLHDAAYLAWGYVAFGDTARALRMLERFDPRTDSHYQLHLHCDAGLDPLRPLPRFKALIVRAAKVCL
jgi:tetratricopeptide (TPR) repeat protein/tRNA A-37 threonylcarbamoyl transferase component Bud32